MIRRPPRSTQSRSSAASDVYKRQVAARRVGRSGGHIKSLTNKDRLTVAQGLELEGRPPLDFADKVEKPGAALFAEDQRQFEKEFGGKRAKRNAESSPSASAKKRGKGDSSPSAPAKKRAKGKSGWMSPTLLASLGLASLLLLLVALCCVLGVASTVMQGDDAGTVSYTHLTLPTIYSV